MSQLEHAVGVRLFERSTRKVTLTEAGEKFQVRARGLLAELDDTIAGVRRSADRLEGRIRMMVPTTLHMLVLSEALSAFQHSHEHISLELALVDRSVNPAEEGFDLAVTGHAANSYEGVLDLPLHPYEQVLCASPDYLQRRGTPVHPRDLADHDGLFFKALGTAWRFQSEQGELSVDVPARLVATDFLTLRSAAVHGNGLALLPRYVAIESLREGRLVEVLARYPAPRSWFRAHVTRHRSHLARITAVLDCVKSTLASALPPVETRMPQGMPPRVVAARNTRGG